MKKFLGIMILLIFVSCGQEDALLNVDNSTIIDKVGTLGESCYPTEACDAGLKCSNSICNRVEKISINTVIITKQEIGELLSISIEDMQYRFAKNQRTAKFKPGTILGFPDTKMTPKGGVAKITKVTDLGDVLIFDIAAPSITEILGQNQTLKIHRTLGDNQRFLPEGADSFSHKEENRELYSTNFPLNFNYPNEINPILALNGSADIALTLDFEIKTGGMLGLSVDKLFYQNKLVINNHFTVKIAADKSVDLMEIKSISKFLQRGFDLGSFEKEVYGFNIVFDAKMAVSLEPKASIHGKANLSFENVNTVLVGYEKGGKGIFGDFDMTNKFEADWYLKGTLNLDLVAEASMKLKVAGDVKGFPAGAKADFGAKVVLQLIDAEGELEGSHGGSNSFCYKLNGGVVAGAWIDSSIFATIPFFGKKSFSYKKGAPDTITWKWSWLKILKQGEFLGTCSGSCKGAGLECKKIFGLGQTRCYPNAKKVDMSGDKECKTFRCNTNEDCRAGEGNDALICNQSTHKCEDGGNTSSYQTVHVDGGDFKRGCTLGDSICNSDFQNAIPIKTVTLTKGFDIGKFEVTVKEYKECVTAGKCTAPENGTYFEENNEKLPITGITWKQATQFCGSLGANWRLPTDAQWEKAAKGGTNDTYIWGSADGTCNDATMEMSDEDSTCTEENSGIIREVGSVAKDNRNGIMDLAGNVQEWVFDMYMMNYYSTDEVVDPQGMNEGEGHSVRGGSYSHLASHPAFKIFYREEGVEGDSSDTIGFRCAKTDQ